MRNLLHRQISPWYALIPAFFIVLFVLALVAHKEPFYLHFNNPFGLGKTCKYDGSIIYGSSYGPDVDADALFKREENDCRSRHGRYDTCGHECVPPGSGTLAVCVRVCVFK